MSRRKKAGKPKGPFRAPTCLTGGSNSTLHGRVGLFIISGWWIMTTMLFWRIKHKIEFFIEKTREYDFKMEYFSPPEVL